ncbi:MAG: YihY/virulence factor BrkB family protein [Cytophagales bacterium]|nr:YihY/virulence factor BrkB family protein [Cytophagales bacterium]
MKLSKKYIAILLLAVHNIKITKYKLSLREILTDFFRELVNDNVVHKAQAMAFNFTLAFFPGILFLINIIPYIPIPDFTHEVLLFIEDSMPESIYLMLQEVILDINLKPHTGVMSVGFILAILAAMNGTLSMMSAFNECYNNAVDKRNFITTRLIAFVIMLILVGALILAIGSVSYGGYYISYLLKYEIIKSNFASILHIVRYVVVIALFFTAISVIYSIAPAVKTRWSFFSYGSVLATILSVVTTYIFSYYLDHYANYNKTYGSIGTFIGLLLWFYIASLLLLVGFEFNAAIDAVKNKGQIVNVKKINMRK